ncbi:DUF4920 domain-containing protein [Polaribacter sp.]|uniref:DUF4920 domain-containing protein n=1 Tax=Polaribacter sp. TaxID=1920175 RepID=UPI003EFAE744
MKYLMSFCLIILVAFAACKEGKKTAHEKTEPKKELAFDSFGEKLISDNAITSSELLAKYETMKTGDTINIKFASSIKEVCSKKGCWMKLPLGEDAETMVRFKDYGFFMPLDAKDKEVIVAGKGFVKETSVKELQHYAEDAGKSKEEIAKITEPKTEYTFVADGVLIKK